MPTYVYECEDCEHQKEVFHGMNEEPEIICDKCGKPMEKIIAPGGSFILGEGFPGKEWKKMRQLKDLPYKGK